MTCQPNEHEMVESFEDTHPDIKYSYCSKCGVTKEALLEEEHAELKTGLQNASLKWVNDKEKIIGLEARVRELEEALRESQENVKILSTTINNLPD